MSFAIFDSDIALCSGDEVLTINLETWEEKIITLRKVAADSKLNEILSNRSKQDNLPTTMSVVFSRDGQYLLIYSIHKQLCVFERGTGQLVFKKILLRAPSKACFTGSNDIVVADKSGDAYLYLMKEPTTNGKLLLGHLSMLLDVLVSEDGKYIITADRDEKIRVSMFPNCYNIASYCLGHTKFVTNVNELPHDKSVVISAGGDGLFKLWDYKTGTEIRSVDFSEHFCQDEIEKFNQNMRIDDFDQPVQVLPVKHMRLMQLDETSSVAIASFYGSSRIIAYTIRNTEFHFLTSMNVASEPLECLFANQKLWILTDEAFIVYELQHDAFFENNKNDETLKKLNESWQNIRITTNRGQIIPTFYKRRFDNVQEYQERKKNRLIKSNE